MPDFYSNDRSRDLAPLTCNSTDFHPARRDDFHPARRDDGRNREPAQASQFAFSQAELQQLVMELMG
jgi:hypothetical protein